MSRFDPMARQSRLDDWAALATDAVGHAADPALDPTDRFRSRAENAGVWAWPRSSDVRCRALQQVARAYCAASTADERAVLGGPMRALARAVQEAVEAVRTPVVPPRKDIEG